MMRAKRALCNALGGNRISPPSIFPHTSLPPYRPHTSLGLSLSLSLLGNKGFINLTVAHVWPFICEYFPLFKVWHGTAWAVKPLFYHTSMADLVFRLAVDPSRLSLGASLLPERSFYSDGTRSFSGGVSDLLIAFIMCKCSVHACAVHDLVGHRATFWIVGNSTAEEMRSILHPR